MLTRIGAIANRWACASDPWTNVYGLARTMLALATAGTLAANRVTTLFHPCAGVPGTPPICQSRLASIGLFCAVPGSLELRRWIAVLLLVLVASGWRPRLTGLLHWWLSFSLVNNAVLLDGGDQVAMIVSFLLIPIALTDSRRWHWQAPLNRPVTLPEKVRRLVARGCFAAIMVQVAGIYFHSAIGKFAVEEWTDGTALYYWMLHPSFGASPWLVPAIAPLLRNAVTITLLTWSVLILEYVLSAALFMTPRRRARLLPFGLALHAGIVLVHGLVSFSSIMAAALVLYLRPAGRPLRWLAFEIPERWRRHTMRELTRHVALVVIITFTLQAVSCAPSSTPVARRYDGKTIFRGLMFRDGVVAKRVPELWKLLGTAPRPTADKAVETLRTSARQLDAAGEKAAADALIKVADNAPTQLPARGPESVSSTATINATISSIEAADPTFFTRFGNDIQSGDPVRVDRAMSESSRLTMRVLSGRINSGDTDLARAVWYYWDIFVAIEFVAVVLIFVLAVWPAVTATTQEKNLLHDDAVKIITERLYVPGGTSNAPNVTP